MSDAPEEYIERQLGFIVGLELTITRLIGKWKISQNRPKHDRLGAIAGLSGQGTESSIAMARLMEEAANESE